jgi:hypothetical protein
VMAEFRKQIPIGNGKVEFLRDDKQRLLTQISGSGPLSFRAMYQLAISQDGRILGAVPSGGLVTNPPPPAITAFIQSDIQGMWGRVCPACHSYFRSNHVMGATVCPYCSQDSGDLAFITDAQKRYSQAFLDAALSAIRGSENVAIDLESLTDATPEWQYSEEQQQFHFKCADPKCFTETDILGDFGWCPCCGRTNSLEVIENRLEANEERLLSADRDLSDRQRRNDEWEIVNGVAFSIFESLGNHLRTRLVLFPATPKRRNEIQELSFQRIAQCAPSLENWFDIQVFRNIRSDDQAFVNKMLHRRHIVTHNAGRADQNYLDHSGDTSCRLNERIRIRSNEVKRLLPLIRKMCENLLNGFDALA